VGRSPGTSGTGMGVRFQIPPMMRSRAGGAGRDAVRGSVLRG
jgi:hypothetical protein